MIPNLLCHCLLIEKDLLLSDHTKDGLCHSAAWQNALKPLLNELVLLVSCLVAHGEESQGKCYLAQDLVGYPAVIKSSLLSSNEYYGALNLSLHTNWTSLIKVLICIKHLV